MNDKDLLYFGGTAYLGIPFNSQFQQLLIDGIRKWGANSGSSRGNNLSIPVYGEAEEHAAEVFGAQAALIVSSGYLAAQLAVRAFEGHAEYIYAPNAHPALWLDNSHPQVLAETYAQWAEQVLAYINESNTKQFVLLSNSVNNLYPEVYNWNWIREINADKQVILLLDDAHGLGLLGQTGDGIYQQVPDLVHVKKVVVGSMAKALGIDAGLVLSDVDTIAQLKATPMFNGASPPSPAFMHAFMHAGAIYDKEREKLRRNIAQFVNGLKPKHGLIFTESLPIYYTADETLHDRLLAEGINISSFPYPNQFGKPLNRIVLSSTHSEKDIDRLLKAIAH